MSLHESTNVKPIAGSRLLNLERPFCLFICHIFTILTFLFLETILDRGFTSDQISIIFLLTETRKVLIKNVSVRLALISFPLFYFTHSGNELVTCYSHKPLNMFWL